MRGKKRPLSERNRAVALAVVHGSVQAAEMTGIPYRTVKQWNDSPEFAALRTRTKSEVAEEWWAIVQAGFRRTAELLTETADVQKAAVATAIIFDKLALTRGEATTRSEHRDLRDELDAEARRKIAEWADGLDSSADPGGEAGSGADIRQPAAESVLLESRT